MPANEPIGHLFLYNLSADMKEDEMDMIDSEGRLHEVVIGFRRCVLQGCLQDALFW